MRYLPLSLIHICSRLENNAARQELVKRAEALGCEIGSHTWSHKDLRKVDETAAGSEIEKADDILENVLGRKAAVLRPPYGDFRGPVRERVNKPMILWNLDSDCLLYTSYILFSPESAD